tara:strand:- start:52 stop:357 length:306 start_codon:yes stop_codon:yes gene_type:complete
MSSLLAHDSGGETRQPQQKKQFNLSYYDIRQEILQEKPSGEIIVEFEINEEGKVENPVIRDAFDVRLSDTIIDKVLMLDFEPALQNGRPIRVRYKLPILFK